MNPSCRVCGKPDACDHPANVCYSVVAGQDPMHPPARNPREQS